jgi:hypothetical protein
MVFYKPPYNNKDMPLLFMRKLWVGFILGKPVNYFGIGEFQGVGRGSTQDQEHVRHEPVLGTCRSRRRSKLPTQHPLVVESFQHVQLAISSLTHSLVQNNSFVALSR